MKAAAAHKTFRRDPALRVTTLERDPRKPDTWARSLVTTVPLDAALDLPVGPDRRVIIEETAEEAA